MRMRLVRTYEVPELRGRATSKSKECLFHDEEKYEYLAIEMSTSLNISLHSGEVRITSSYDATKLWFNHYYPEYTKFKAKLSKESTPMRTISTTSIVSQSTDLRDFISGSVVITTIADLYQQTESGDFYVPAMITGIESSGEWYYTSCKTKGCNKKLKSENRLIYCEKCDRKWQNGAIKYKLVVRVADATIYCEWLDFCFRRSVELV
nr:replication factor A protein 1-like [Ipomoea batatas]